MLMVVSLCISAVPAIVGVALSGDASAAAQTNYVRVGMMEDIINWNPLTIDRTKDYIACYLIHSVLLQYDQDRESVMNDLATGYYQIVHPAGNMSTIINITSNAYFRNKMNPTDTSHPLTAVDVKYTFDLIKSNPGGSWDYFLDNFTGVYVTGTYQIKIDTDFPKASLIDDLVWIPILPKYLWETVNPPLVLRGKDPAWLVGSGPFYYDDSAQGSWYKFTKAPNYHASVDFPLDHPEGDRVIDIDGLLYTVYTEPVALTMAMNDGVEDCIELRGEPNLFLNTLGVDPAVNIIKQVITEKAITDIAINAIPMEFRKPNYATGNPLLLDPIVRKAIGMTLNKDYIVNTILFGLPRRADSVLDPSVWHKDIQNELPYSPAWARENLTANGYADLDSDGYLEATAAAYPVQMGWADSGAKLSFRLEAPDIDPSYEAIGLAWVSWARDAGIQFNYATRSETVMINSAWYKADYDLWVWYWEWWGPEPLKNLSPWLTAEIHAGGWNCQMPMGPWWVWDPVSKTGYSAYDENFTVAMKTLDRDERKVIVDKLQQWIYDSWSEFPPVYPAGLYAYTDERFVGWGDWTQHIGRAFTSDLLWTWFDLVPAGGNQMPEFQTPLQDTYQVIINEEATFVVEVWDPEADPLTVNWTFGDSGTAQNTSSGSASAVRFVQKHTYTALAPAGIEMRVTAWDGTSGNTATSRATVYVVSYPDTVPSLVTAISHDPPFEAYVDEVVTWSVGAMDSESGGPTGFGLQFTWVWDDGTTTVSRHQPITNDTMVTDTQTHSWFIAGYYYVELFVWDGSSEPDHNVSMGVVEYFVKENQPPEEPVISSITTNEDVWTECVASSSDLDGDALRFTWDWGDGTYNVTNEASPSPDATVESKPMHQWASVGDYTVTVWVDDLTGEAGHNVSASITAHVLATGAPVPPSSLSLMISPSPALVGVTVTFNASAVDMNADGLTFMIDFGDGNMSVATTAGGVTTRQYVSPAFTHAYEAADAYTVRLYVDDGTVGHNVTISQTLTVSENVPPTISLPSTLTARYNRTFTVVLTATDADGDALSVWLDWGDSTAMTAAVPGTTANSYVATHVYEVGGSMTLTVYADDGTELEGHNVSATRTVTISENLKPTIVSVAKWPAGPYEPGATVAFIIVVKDYEGDNVNITVNFGDGSAPFVDCFRPTANTNTERNITHVYAEGRSTPYTVTVTVDDGMMQFHSVKTWSSQTTTVTVTPPPSEGGGIGAAVLVGIAILVIVVLAVIAMLMKRKKGAGEGGAEGGMKGMTPPQ